MKKLLLTLGAVASVAAPVAAVVACSNNADTNKGDTFVFTSHDLIENFSLNNTDLADQTIQLAEDLLTRKGDVDEIGSLKVLNFTLDGKAGSFDFTTDKFLHNGLVAGSTGQPTADLKKSHPNVDIKVGEFAEYVKPVLSNPDASEIVAIDPVKGLVINSSEVANLDNLQKAAHIADAAKTVTIATAADKTLSAEVTKIENRLRFVIRMAVAAASDLHVNEHGTWTIK